MQDIGRGGRQIVGNLRGIRSPELFPSPQTQFIQGLKEEFAVFGSETENPARVFPGSGGGLIGRLGGNGHAQEHHQPRTNLGSVLLQLTGQIRLALLFKGFGSAAQPGSFAWFRRSRKKREEQVSLPGGKKPGSGFVVAFVDPHEAGSSVAVREYFWRAWT
jgi:hypothetical protein